MVKWSEELFFYNDKSVQYPYKSNIRISMNEENNVYKHKNRAFSYRDFFYQIKEAVVWKKLVSSL